MAAHPKKKKKMLSFDLKHVAGVDKMAQEPAGVLMFKNGALAKTARMTDNNKGAAHLLDVSEGHGQTTSSTSPGKEFAHWHPWITKDDGSIVIGDAEGHGHEVIEKINPEAAPAAAGDSSEAGITKAAGQDGNEETMSKEKPTVETVEKSEFEEMQKRAERAEKISELKSPEREHFAKLNEEDQNEFLTKTPEARTAEIAKAGEADPVVWTDARGTEYRKSTDPVILQLAKDNEDLRKQATESAEKAQGAELAKRADSELKNLSGKDEDKIALLKSIESIEDKDQRGRVAEMLKAKDLGLGLAFETMGTSGAANAGDSPEDKLDALAKTRAAEKSISFEKAYDEVVSGPEGQRLYAESVEPR